MQWLNEPPAWHKEGDTIRVRTAAQSDFWRKTHDGGIRDNGHFYHETVTGDFIAQVKVTGRYAGLYDQAGLMVRLDESTWLKCGIEFVSGVQNASVVVTRDYSDWSIQPLNNPAAIWLRVARHGGTIEVSFSLDGETYSLVRQTWLTDKPTVQVGVMAASPKGDGFDVTFEGLTISPAA